MEKPNKVLQYISKYPFKRGRLAHLEDRFLFEGKLEDCPEELLKGVMINEYTKFVRVYKG